MPDPLQEPLPPHSAARRELLGEFSVRYRHRIIFTDGVFDPPNPALAAAMHGDASTAPARAAVFIDSALADRTDIAGRIGDYFQHHAAQISLAGPPTLVSGGEVAKADTRTFDRCVEALHRVRLDRHSYAVAVGGGAVLDAVGFAASAVHRGVRQIRVPTTVLAQADAGIGVKNGINYRGSKNFLGCFAPPKAVLNDFTLLATLPPQHWRDGTVEAVKVALIRDAEFFDWIEQNIELIRRADPAAMRHLIFRCAQLHLNHIATAGDPFEQGSARPLDFGHWAAHKLEQLTAGALSHGHAVAIGMAIDVAYAQRLGLVGQSTADRIAGCLLRLGFTVAAGPMLGMDCQRAGEVLIEGIEEFREHLGGALSITMLRGIGQAVEVRAVDHRAMRACVQSVLCPTDPRP